MRTRITQPADITTYNPAFLLNIDHRGKQDAEILAMSEIFIAKEYFDKKPQIERRAFISSKIEQVIFIDRHDISTEGPPLSAHQKMARTRMAETEFQGRIWASWFEIFRICHNGRAWYEDIISPFSAFDHGPVLVEEGEFIARPTMKDDLKKQLTCLFEGAMNFSNAAQSFLINSRYDEEIKRIRRHQDRLPRILHAIDATEHGAFSLAHKNHLRDWMAIDLTFGLKPNAIVTQKAHVYSALF